VNSRVLKVLTVVTYHRKAPHFERGIPDTYLAVMIIVLLFISTRALEDPCTSPLHWSGTRNITIPVKQLNRTFELFVPFEGHGMCGIETWCTGPPKHKRPLVINWHGCNGHMPLVNYHTTISKVSDRAKDYSYFAIHPVGTKQDGGSNWGWNADGIPCGQPGADDFIFFEALLQFAETELCVDMSRVYTIGFSTGAFLSYGIACRYPSRIAAAGTNAGGLSRLYADVCRVGEGAVPIQSFHSLADPTVPYDGNIAWAGQEEMNALWRTRNGCTKNDDFRITFQSNTTLCKRWDCPKAPVEACALKDIDHCWYGGRNGGFPECTPRPGDVDATAHMFAFWEELASHSEHHVVPFEQSASENI